MSRSTRRGAGVAAVLAAVLAGASPAQAAPGSVTPSDGGESAQVQSRAGQDHHAGHDDHGGDHGGGEGAAGGGGGGGDQRGVPGAPRSGEAHDDHGDDHAGDHGGDHGGPGAPGAPQSGQTHDGHGDDHGDEAGGGHGEEAGGGHGGEPDTVTPETRRLVLSGFGGLNAAVLTAALLLRLRDRRTGTARTGRRTPR